jgi:hypothetical protein
VFVSCLGFKPSKREIQNMLDARPETQRGSQSTMYCNCSSSHSRRLCHVQRHSSLFAAGASCLLVVSYDSAFELLSRKKMYLPAEDALRQMFHALDSQQRGFIVWQDLQEAAMEFARQLDSSPDLRCY